jgi:CRISPR-associated protein Cas2
VHQVAKAWGYPLQYSVFVCDLTRSELLLMKNDLVGEMSVAQDSIGIFDLGPPTGRGVQCVEFIGQSRELPDADAEVW